MCTKSRWLNPMVMSISLSERDSVQTRSSGPQLGYPTKVTLRKMAKFISVRYESALNQGGWIQWWCLFHSLTRQLPKKVSRTPRVPRVAYRGHVFWIRGPVSCFLGKGNQSCLPYNLLCSAAAKMVLAFSLIARLKAVDATDLGSRGTYGIGVLSRKNM